MCVKSTKIQSFWRMHQAVSNFDKMKTLHFAAVKIQSLWRRFWDFSHYVILQYEIIRIQARARGKIAVVEYNLKLGCCILIQSVARTYLAGKSFTALKNIQAMKSAEFQGRREKWAVQRLQLSWRTARDTRNSVRSADVTRSVLAEEMRERLSVRRIQFWWRVVVECRREKWAALVIERFFLMIKAEIEREINRREQRRSTRSKQRRDRKAKDPEDYFLERVWSSTVDTNTMDTFSVSTSTPTFNNSTPRLHLGAKSKYSINPTSTKSSTSSFHPKNEEKRIVSHRASSPSMNLVMRHDQDLEDQSRCPDEIHHVEEESSIVSGLTFLTSTTPHHRRQLVKTPTSKGSGGLQTFSPELSRSRNTIRLGNESNGKMSAADKYMKMYGIKSAASRADRGHHFFADDLESVASSLLPMTPGRTPSSSHKAAAMLNSFREASNSREMSLDAMRSPSESTRTPSSAARRRSFGSHDQEPQVARTNFTSNNGRRKSGSHGMSESPNATHRLSSDSRDSQGRRSGQTMHQHPIHQSSDSGITSHPALKSSSPMQQINHSDMHLYGGNRSECSMQYSMSEVSPTETHVTWGLKSTSTMNSRQSKSPGHISQSRSPSNSWISNQPGSARARSILSTVQSKSPKTPEQRSRSVMPIRMSEPRYEQRRSETALPRRESTTDPRFESRRKVFSPTSNSSRANNNNLVSPPSQQGRASTMLRSHPVVTREVLHVHHHHPEYSTSSIRGNNFHENSVQGNDHHHEQHRRGVDLHDSDEYGMI
jgi:IQ calmodulin-binding motif